MIRLFGNVGSRAHRVMWMLEELGLAYESVEAFEGPRGEERPTAQLLAVDPFGKVPVLQDGDLALSQSLAINLHLAASRGSELWPKTESGQAKALQWTLFAATELERPLFDVFAQRRSPEPRPEVDDTIDAALTALERPLGAVDEALRPAPFLVEGGFSVADLNVATILAFAQPADIDLGPWPGIRAWLQRCLSRPAARSVFGRLVAGS